MGGPGSGRDKEIITTCDILMTDEDFKENVKIKTVLDYNAVLNVLMNIIRGEENDYVFNSKEGVMVSRKPSLADRVKAAKVWKEMTLDKVVSDKKTVDVPQSGNLFDLLNTIKDVEDKVEAARVENAKRVEESLQAEGKLRKLGAD